MSSAMATPPGSSAGAQSNHPTGRPMRCTCPPTKKQSRIYANTTPKTIVKVAYTFDDESKSNCLARYPHLVHSRAVQVDRDLLVGAVEFKTCILSMISSRLEPKIHTRVVMDRKDLPC